MIKRRVRLKKSKKQRRSRLLVVVYFIYLFGCLLLIDKIYARFEKFPFERTTVILQRWNPVAYRLSEIPGLLYELVPNLKRKDLYIETNSLGVRGREYVIPKPAGVFRIVILGDSVTYGLGLDKEQVFSVCLEDKLNAEFGPDRKYEVINTSVPGYNILQEYVALVNKFFIYEPDLIIAGVNQTDLSPSFVQIADSRGRRFRYLDAKLNKEQDILENLTPPQALSISMPDIFHLPTFIHKRLLLSSSLYRAITVNSYDYLSSRNRTRFPPQAYLNIVYNQNEYALKSLKSFCHERGVGLVFLVFPNLHERPLDEPLNQVIKIVALLNKNSIAYLDLSEYYAARTKRFIDLALYPKNGDFLHINAFGQKLTAEAIFDYLVLHKNTFLKD